MSFIDSFERLSEDIISRFEDILSILRSPLTLLVTWSLLSSLVLFPLLIGFTARLSEKIMEDVVAGRKPSLEMSLDDLAEVLLYALLITPITLLFCSPTLTVTIYVAWKLKEVGSDIFQLSTLVLILVLILPAWLGIQLIAVIPLPFSVLRFIEERDYRYSLSLRELLTDIDQMKEELWDIIANLIIDLFLVSLPVIFILLALARGLPIALWLIISYLSFTFIISLILLKTIRDFAIAYTLRFLRVEGGAEGGIL